MASGYRFVVGCDEAGRGPLFGPVVGAACYIPLGLEVAGLADSKQLSESKRLEIYEFLTNHPEIKYSVSVVSAKEIDRINILQASLKAMKRAVKTIGLEADFVLIDGNIAFKSSHAKMTVVNGDSRVACIAAASVLAKVHRDRLLTKLAKKYPHYGLERNKGYPTQYHLEMLKVWGPTEEHRMTFGPLKKFSQVLI